jgi:hypothetical protein
MSEKKYEVVVEPRHVRDAEPALVGAGIHQHRRRTQALERRFAPFTRRNTHRAIRVLAPLALGLNLLLIALDSSGPLLPGVPIPLSWLAVFLSVLTLTVYCFNHDQATRWANLVADRLILRAIRKVVRRTARRAPFSVIYRLQEQEMLVQAPSLGITKRIQPDQTKLVRRSGPLYLFYASSASQRWSNIVYVGTQEQDDALSEFLRRHEIEMVIDPETGSEVLR